MDFLGSGNFFVSGVYNIFDEVAVRERFQNLCAKVGVECKEHFARAQTATETRDWAVAHSEWTSCRDIIERSEGLLDRDESLWLSSCHKLVSANLWAFHSKNFELALNASIEAFLAEIALENVPEALSFPILPTLWTMIFLWASTSECEEETLDPNVRSFLTTVYPGNAVPDCEVRILKQQCKDFVINEWEFVIWEVQKQYFYYFKIEECLRWAREGNKFYGEKYDGKLDYVSKLYEAATLFMTGACEEVIKVCENIREKCSQINDTNIYPAAQYYTVEYAFMIHQMLYICYWKIMLGPGQATEVMIEQQAKLGEEWNLLLSQVYSNVRKLLPLKICLVESSEHAENNRWEEVKACLENLGQYLDGWILGPIAFERFHTNCKVQYRKSYQSGSPDAKLFSSAESWAEVLRKSNSYSNISLWQSHCFVRLVQLYHEKDREVMFVKQSPVMGDVNSTGGIVEYGRKATECYLKALCQPTKHDDYYIPMQKLLNDVYYMLQFHYFALWIRSHECTLDSTINIMFPDRLQQLWNKSVTSEVSSADSTSQEIWRQSFLWAERQVGKAIYFQLARNMLTTSAMDQLVEFDLKDDAAWNILKSSRAACGPGTVVLEYVVSKTNDLQFVYVMTKADEVFMQVLKINGLDSILSCLLKWSRETVSEHHNCEGAPIDASLEWFYEVLISPVAHFLDDMKQEDKLIIVAPEVLSDVPFAALRKPNSPVGEGYLIQSHTISITPSLRMLQHCNQRLKELDQKGILVAKPGTVVLVGDPANNLPASGEEVNFIEKLFGEEHVKTLVESEATPAKVLEWAKYPSENGVKQVVFHIAAHGIGQDDCRNVKKGAIVLARPTASCQQNCDSAGQGAMSRAQEGENFDYDNAQDESELRDLLFAMVDVKGEAQTSNHGEVGGFHTGIVLQLSKLAPDILKSENISGCGFRWEAQMVVLSACDSARGQITGEGVLNLPRALMIAGVPSVVVSQWRVDDQPTCEVMKGFYEELKSGKDVSSSLRASMLKMIKNGRKVHEWAPFFVCGLPTVCLPTELQAATSSCLCDDSGTSSDTKAKLRIKNGKMKPVPADDPIKRFYQLVRRGPVTYWACLADLGENLIDLGKGMSDLVRKIEDDSASQIREMRDMDKWMTKFLATLTPEQRDSFFMDGGKVPESAPFSVCGLPMVCLPTELQAGTSSCKGHDCGTSSETKAELRDKELDQRQHVVQHLVGNVDHDGDMLIEEAHKLRTFLRHKIKKAQGQGGSTIFLNLHELHSKFLEDTSIFIGARKNVENDSIEFLFLDAQCMSKVVGVGLHQALVTVTNENDVKVEVQCEKDWKDLLASMVLETQDSRAFELIGFKMPKMEKDNYKTMRLASAEQVAKQFGVGLKDFQGDYIVTMNKKEESNTVCPVILKVAEVYKALKEGDSHVTKRPSGVGSSSGAVGAPSSGSSQQGKEEGENVQNQSLWKPSIWWKWGKGEEKDDGGKPPGGDPPPNFGPSSEPKMVPRTYTVKVYPKGGHKFRDAIKIPPQIKTASMKPKLTIVFFRDKTGAKFLNVTTQTQCNLGSHANTEQYFGWFQDDIKISFRGSSSECEGIALKDFSASVQGGEKGELTKETTNITLGGSTSVSNLESRGMFGQGMLAGFGMQVQVQEDTTNTFGQNSSRADTEETVGVKQIDGFNVHNHNLEEDLIYKFCIPPGTRNSNNPMRFLRYKDTFTPIIVGKWDVFKGNAFEAANFTFNVERHLFEQCPITRGSGRPQDYVLEMLINLAMTHLDGLRLDETIEIFQQELVGNFDQPGVQLFPLQ